MIQLERKISFVQKRQCFIIARWKYNSTHFTNALRPLSRVFAPSLAHLRNWKFCINVL